LEHLIFDVEERYIAMRMARKKHAKILLTEQRAHLAMAELV
jgi:hypothetical protein